jgi:hypothetical protein
VGYSIVFVDLSSDKECIERRKGEKIAHLSLTLREIVVVVVVAFHRDYTH